MLSTLTFWVIGSKFAAYTDMQTCPFASEFSGPSHEVHFLIALVHSGNSASRKVVKFWSPSTISFHCVRVSWWVGDLKGDLNLLPLGSRWANLMKLCAPGHSQMKSSTIGDLELPTFSIWLVSGLCAYLVLYVVSRDCTLGFSFWHESLWAFCLHFSPRHLQLLAGFIDSFHGTQNQRCWCSILAKRNSLEFELLGLRLEVKTYKTTFEGVQWRFSEVTPKSDIYVYNIYICTCCLGIPSAI